MAWLSRDLLFRAIFKFYHFFNFFPTKIGLEFVEEVLQEVTIFNRFKKIEKKHAVSILLKLFDTSKINKHISKK